MDHAKSNTGSKWHLYGKPFSQRSFDSGTSLSQPSILSFSFVVVVGCWFDFDRTIIFESVVIVGALVHIKILLSSLAVAKCVPLEFQRIQLTDSKWAPESADIKEIVGCWGDGHSISQR